MDEHMIDASNWMKEKNQITNLNVKKQAENIVSMLNDRKESRNQIQQKYKNKLK